jgi:phosphodiesterase/alkaline phosphatase D-like protein
MQCGALLTRAAVARLYLVVLNVDTHRCWAPDYYTNYAQFRYARAHEIPLVPMAFIRMLLC